MQSKKVVLGGTFDRLHAGHEAHLMSAFILGGTVTIGLTTNEMVATKELSELIEPYEKREQKLRAYIEDHWSSARYSIVQISDIYGPTLTDTSFDTIVVTPDTRANGQKVIEKRTKAGLNKLRLVEAPLVRAKDGGALSSTRIRFGQIDRQGRPYNALFEHSLSVPEAHRDALRQPIGTTTGSSADHALTAQKALAIIHKFKPTLLITVGDIVTSALLQVGLHPNIALIDLKSDGKNLEHIEQPDAFDVENPSGTIQSKSVTIIEKTIANSLRKMSSKVILVDGEEDLLALPCILLAPLNAVVIYGQKDHGIILNFVTEELKTKVKKLVELLI